MTLSADPRVIVLAAGEGSRLQALTTDEQGGYIPKQFCSFHGDRSLLRYTLDRAGRLVPPERIVPVVAEQHWLWWEAELSDLPRRNIVVQPENRGTAAGLLLPLLHVLLEDREAPVVILPSDHYVGDEDVLQETLERALRAVRERPDRLVLLGITPDDPDSEYGWILPMPERGEIRPVASFVEKPPREAAQALMAKGAVWNSFMLAGSGMTLLRFYEKALPELLAAFLMNLEGEGWRPGGLDALYRGLPKRDFSRDVLEKVVASLDLLPAPPCGWTDLGTPERVAECLERQGRTLGAWRDALRLRHRGPRVDRMQRISA